jgi:hypothetical protein
MYIADDLIDKIVGSSQVPGGKRRQEIARELRAHIEDFVLIAREAGHTEEEIAKLVAANFGDPQEIAKEFATVYRRERAIQRVSVFLLATLASTSLISIVVLGLQASLAFSLGVPVARVFAGHHLKLETLYIFCTVAAYVGLLSLERLFDRARSPKALALLAAIFAVSALGVSRVDLAPEILIAAFVSGALLRATQIFLKTGIARLGVATACFGLFGLASACRQWPNIQNESVVQLVVWVAIGVCGYLMTNFSRRVDRALSNGT